MSGAGGVMAAAASSSGGGPGAETGDALALARELNAGIQAMASLRLRDETPEVQLSKATETLLNTALARLNIPAGGHLDVPDLHRYAPAAGSLPRHTWRVGTTETNAAPTLLATLRSWVMMDIDPPIHNMFADVQRFTPVEFTVEGAGHFTGLPDMMVAREGVAREDELQPLVSTAVLTVDWKTAVAFAKRGQIKAIGSAQAIAYSSYDGFMCGQPAFMTDMASGFRCWMVTDNKLFYLHPNDRDFTLEEGVALIRWFLVHEATHVLRVENRTAVWVPASESGRRATTRPDGTAGQLPVPAPQEPGAVPGVGSKVTGRSGRFDGLISRDVSPNGTSTISNDDLATVICEVQASIFRGGMRSIEF